MARSFNDIGPETEIMMQKAALLMQKQTVLVPVAFEVTNDIAGKLREDILQDLLRDALRDMIKKHFTDAGSEFSIEFHKFTKDKEYYPKVMHRLQEVTVNSDYGADDVLTDSPRRQKSRKERKWVTTDRYQDGFVQGFKDLWKALSTEVQPTSSPGMVVGGVAPVKTVESVRLSRYMFAQGSTSTSSLLNSFFWATEWGTGIAENVGAGNVRTEGDTKLKGDASLAGAWFLGPDDERGLLFTGQKATHFLYGDNRQLDPKWRHYIEKWLPGYVELAIERYILLLKSGAA